MPDDADALHQIRVARYQADLAEEEVTRLVRIARELGSTWERIAAALGVSRQSAWERYGRDQPSSS